MVLWIGTEKSKIIKTAILVILSQPLARLTKDLRMAKNVSIH